MRFRSLLLAGSLILAASSAMAEDAPAKKEAAPGDATLELLGDVVDGVGGFGLAQRIAEHHGGGEDLRDGVGDAFACDVRRAAAAWFKEAETPEGGFL